VNAAGEIVWASDGVRLRDCAGLGSQAWPKIASDAAGGAIVTWQDWCSGGGIIYAQRVDATGGLLWTTDAVSIGTAWGNEYSVRIVADGTGGAIVAWEDHSSGTSDIYAQRIDANGNNLWTGGWVMVCTAAMDQQYPELVSDGTGGAVITWVDNRIGNLDIYAQLVTADGNAPIATLLQNHAATFSNTGISLTWMLSAVDEGAEFFIERSTSPTSSFIELPSGALTRSGLSFSFIDRNWEPNATYWYRVQYSTGSERRILFESGPVTTPTMPLTLYQNSPNPFNPSTEIRYYLPEKCSVSLDVYNVNGVLVARLSEGQQSQGSHTVSWDGRDRNGKQASSGVYFYRLKAGKTEIAKKMVLTR
jgi:hypothetical protein